MKGLILAIQFLTRLPTPRINAATQDLPRAVRWFPVIGLLLGALVAGAALAGAKLGAWTGALAALVAWVALTGALHLDGLADIADAAGAAHKGPDRLRAVLADPHVGSFGAVAIALQLIAKLVLLHALVERSLWLPICVAPFAARIAPLGWALALRPLHEGLGSLFRDGLRPLHLFFWGAVLVGAAWLVPALLATPLIAALWGLWLRRRIGGISGDGHGAGIELVETGLLACSLFAAAP